MKSDIKFEGIMDKTYKIDWEKNDMDKSKKITIRELEEIIGNKENLVVEILPNGEIQTVTLADKINDTIDDMVKIVEDYLLDDKMPDPARAMITLVTNTMKANKIEPSKVDIDKKL
jgi:hypothetical protein